MKSTLILYSLLFIFVFHSYHSALIAQSKEGSISSQLDKYLTSYQQVKNVPSVSAGLLSRDSIIWHGYRGFIDIENFVPADSNSLYRIASISKPITAVAIMQLWEKGLLKLDEDVRKYVPYFPQKKWTITIRQLLNHTSGIRTYREGEFHSKTNYTTTREALKVFENDSLLFKPGSDYLYTTLGYTLLAAVIESVARTTFHSYLRENILLPAGMTSTFVDVQRDIIHNRARGYIKNIYRRIENAQLADLSIKVAGGGLISNVRDMLLFSKALLNEKLIRKSTLDSMLVPSRISASFTKYYGLGFSLPEDRSNGTFFHSGSGTGFSSKLIIDRNSKIASIHFLNIADRNLESPADEILKIFTNERFNKPGYIISDTLISYYVKGKLDSVFFRLDQITASDTSGFSIDKTDLAAFGKDLMQQKNNTDAIDYLKRLNRIFPDSFPILVALADVYLNDGNKGMALRNYRLAYNLDKRDRYVNSMIQRLSN